MSAFTSCVDGKAQSFPAIWFTLPCQAVTASIKNKAGEEANTQKYRGLELTGGGILPVTSDTLYPPVLLLNCFYWKNQRVCLHVPCTRQIMKGSVHKGLPSVLHKSKTLGVTMTFCVSFKLYFCLCIVIFCVFELLLCCISLVHVGLLHCDCYTDLTSQTEAAAHTLPYPLVSIGSSSNLSVAVPVLVVKTNRLKRKWFFLASPHQLSAS